MTAIFSVSIIGTDEALWFKCQQLYSYCLQSKRTDDLPIKITTNIGFVVVDLMT